MAKHILGLDIGKSCLKAVLIEAGLRGSTAHRCLGKGRYHRDGRHPGSPAADPGNPGPHRTGMPDIACGKGFSFRNIKLPFKDRKKILETLPFELESQIPHPVESVLIDFTVLGQAQGSDLFTAVIPKAEVQERIALLADYGFDAETIDVDPVPVAARLMTAVPVDSLNLLLDVGASETTGVFFKEGRILQVRSFPFGGDHVTNALSGALGISFVEAEARKKRGDTEKAEEQITEACRKFFASLKNTISSLRMSGLVDEDPATV